MTTDEPTLRSWRATDRDACLALFDANCPAAFAPGERVGYAAFLDAAPAGYRVCELGGRVVGAFGVIDEPGGPTLHWILLDPHCQGRGLGRRIMERVVADGAGRPVSIAASHVSAPFFARFGAVELGRTADGWGPDMHRVDMRLETAES